MSASGTPPVRRFPWSRAVVVPLVVFGLVATAFGLTLPPEEARADERSRVLFLGSVSLPLGVLLGFVWGVFTMPRPNPDGWWAQELRCATRSVLWLLFLGGLVAVVVGWWVGDGPGRWTAWAGWMAVTVGMLFGWWLNAPTPAGAAENPAGVKGTAAATDGERTAPGQADAGGNPTNRAEGGSRAARFCANNIEPLFAWLAAYPLFPLQILLLCLVSWADFARGLGVPDLVWGDRWWDQLWVGVSVSLLFGNVLFVRAVLDRRAGARPPAVGGYSLFWFASNTAAADRRTSPPWACRVALLLALVLIVGAADWATGRRYESTWGVLLALAAAWLAVWGQVRALTSAPVPAPEPVAAADPPSRSAVRDVGAFLLVTWPLALAAFYLPKMVAWGKWRELETGGMALGLLLGIPLTVGLVAVYEYWWRAWWTESWLFRRLPGIASNAIPDDEKPLHALAGLNTFLLPGFFLALLLYEVLFFGAVWSPVWVVCLLLALFNSLYGFVTFHLTGLQYLVVLLVCLLVYTSNSGNSYKMTLPGLERHPLVSLDKEPDPAAVPDLIPTEVLLSNFRGRWQEKRPGEKPKLVIVATTGGGIQAAVWTAMVLEALERDAGMKKNGAAFRDHIRLMTGASGGMQAAGLYAANFTDADSDARAGAKPPLSHQLARDSLWATTQTMLIRDLPALACPARATHDRGRALEAQWVKNTSRWHEGEAPVAGPPDNWFREVLGGYRPEGGTSPFQKNFYALRDSEQRCERPVLVFSPMLVEDCRRVLISNLAMDWFAKTTAPSLNANDASAATTISVPAIEFWRYFPEARHAPPETPGRGGFTVGTAARMSATFPFVGPAVSLPTVPPRRVVDAGYFDNFGVNMAAMWMHHHRKALLEHTSGVVLVEIRAYPRRHEKLHFEQIDPDTGKLVDQSLNWVAAEAGSPLEAIYNLYARSAYFRNDQLLHLLHETFAQERPGGRPFFTTVAFECNQPAALSWTLPRRNFSELQALFSNENPKAACPHLTGEQINRLAESRKELQDSIGKLGEWFGTGGAAHIPAKCP
jgi:hypothetical protein